MPAPRPPSRLVAGLTGSTSTTVYVIVIVLIAVGLGMIAMAVWLVRATRRDHVVLGPLERMGDRSWRKHDPDRRRLELDQVRPRGVPAIEPVSTAKDDLEPAVAEAESAEPAPPIDDQQPAAVDEVPADASEPPVVDGREPSVEGSEPDRDSTPTRAPDPFVARGEREAGS